MGSESPHIVNIVATRSFGTPLNIEITDKTDNLIDQIVYKLYGLTEEEIKVVEGSE